MSQRNRVLMMILAAQVALFAVIRFTNSSPPGIKAEDRLVPAFDAKAVERIEVHAPVKKEPGKTPDTLRIAVVKKNDGWVVENYHGYPADKDVVDELLTAVQNLKSRGSIASGPGRFEQLEVADEVYARKIILKAGDKTTTIYMGGPAGGRRTAIRVGGTSEIHAVAELKPTSAPPTIRPWIGENYFTFPFDDILAVIIANPQGTFSLERTDTDWNATVDGKPLTAPAGKELDPEKAKIFVTKASRVDLTEPSPPRQFNRSARVSVRLKAPLAITGNDSPKDTHEFLLVPVGDEKVYVQLTGSPAVLADQAGLIELFDLKSDDFFRPIDPGKK